MYIHTYILQKDKYILKKCSHFSLDSSPYIDYPVNVSGGLLKLIIKPDNH